MFVPTTQICFEQISNRMIVFEFDIDYKYQVKLQENTDKEVKY